MAMLEVKDINVYYGLIHALRDVSFEVNEGEVVALIGANGAGKTTTLHTITGLLPSKGGTVTFEGRNITRKPGHAIVRLGMSHVPEGRRVFAGLTVAENLRMGAYTRPAGEIPESLKMVYERFPRLEERKNQAAGTLSGGEQQMLAMGRALMSKPRILLLDEGSVPAVRRRDLQDHRGRFQGGHDRASGRAEREEGAVHRGPRLRSRNRQGRQDRQSLRSAERRLDQEGLSRRVIWKRGLVL